MQLIPNRLRLCPVVIGIALLLSTAVFAETVEPAEKILRNFFGVNTHLSNCCGGRYTDLEDVAAKLNYIGARQLRDWVSRQPELRDKWQQVHAATGAPFYASIPSAAPEAQRVALQVMREWLDEAPGLISAIEGGNEEDMPYAVKLGATLEDTAELQHEVYAAGSAAGVPVVQMSVGAGWKAPLWEGNYKNFGRPPADLGNAHVYMNPGEYPTSALQRIGKLAAWSVPDKKVAVTEFGFYQTPQQSDDLTSAFMHLAPFSSYLLGHASFFVYALHDDISGVVGFYDREGEPRAFAHYWHHTTQLLRDDAAKGQDLLAKELDIRFTAQKQAGQRKNGIKNIPLYKTDGSLWIVMFDEQKPGATDGEQTVELDKTYPTLTLYDGRSGKVLRQDKAAQRITVTLPPNHILLLQAK